MSEVSTVAISKRGVKRWRRGHPWIYKSDVKHIDANSGDVVRVQSDNGHVLGWAFYSGSSQITLRRVSRSKEPLEPGIWRERILQAEQRRRQLGLRSRAAYRLLHGEADGFPATIIDRYGSVFVVQTLCAGSDRLLGEIVEVLQSEFSPEAIVERNDPKVRELEGLERKKGLLYGTMPDELVVSIGKCQVYVAPLLGQKTGAYLDQSETLNRSLHYARRASKILDACCYQGWFANSVASVQRKAEVIALDSSGNALDALLRNAQLNELDNVVPLEANLFDQLRLFDREEKRFDLIFLDPPSFIKNRSAKESGLRGYKEVNLRALRLLEPGGILISSSCSYHLDRPTFWNLMQEAAADQAIDIQLLDIWGQGHDHPRLANFPESDYLKTLVVQRLPF